MFMKLVSWLELYKESIRAFFMMIS